MLFLDINLDVWNGFGAVCQRNIKKESDLIKKEIIDQLSSYDIHLNENDYESFSQSILAYYVRNDIEVFSAILIGVAIQRSVLIGASNNDETNRMTLSVTKASLMSIPNNIVADKEELFNEIYKHKGEDLFEILNNFEQLSSKNELLVGQYRKYDVFISHANSDKKDLIDDLYHSLRKLGINIFYDRESLEWGDNWKDKILNGTQNAEFAIIVISENFFGREWTE